MLSMCAHGLLLEVSEAPFSQGKVDAQTLFEEYDDCIDDLRVKQGRSMHVAESSERALPYGASEMRWVKCMEKHTHTSVPSNNNMLSTCYSPG